MKNPFVSKDLSEPTRRRIELAIAVAQERLLTTHVKYALELVELVGDRMSFDTALDVYFRLLRLDTDDMRVVTTQVLARLGEMEADRPLVPAAGEEQDDASDREEHRSFIAQIRQRLRGRVKDDLRRLIELHAARAEVAILRTHVDNAMNFEEILQKEMPFTDAAELYLEALEVRDSIAEVVYYITLDRVSDRYLSPRDEDPSSGAVGEGRSYSPEPLETEDVH